MGRLWKTYRKVNPAKHEVTFAEAEANSYGHGSLFRGENDKAAGYGYAVLSLARMIHTLLVTDNRHCRFVGFCRWGMLSPFIASSAVVQILNSRRSSDSSRMLVL